jgi:hypothetical protein
MVLGQGNSFVSHSFYIHIGGATKNDWCVHHFNDEFRFGPCPRKVMENMVITVGSKFVLKTIIHIDKLLLAGVISPF